MPLNIEIEVQGCDQADINVTQQCETLTLEIIDASIYPSVQIDDDAGLGDTYVTWSADKSSRELADKVDKVAGLGLSELSFTADDKNSLEQSEQDRHTHANKSVIDDLSDNAGALEYRGLPVSDQAALDAKVDKVAGYSLVADDEIAKLATVEQGAQKNTVSSVAGKQGDVLLDKYDVGLGLVDNTADADKPVSTAVAAALTNKVDKAAGKVLSDENYTTADKDKVAGIQAGAQVNAVTSVSGRIGAVTLTKEDVGLPNVDNTTDINKPISTATASALSGKVDKVSGKGLSESDYTTAEKTKLAGVAAEATKNRADSENADKVHSHAIGQVDGLSAALLTKFEKTDVVQSTGQSTEKVMSQKAVTDELGAINLLIGDTSAALDAINGEVI